MTIWVCYQISEIGKFLYPLSSLALRKGSGVCVCSDGGTQLLLQLPDLHAEGKKVQADGKEDPLPVYWHQVGVV